MNRPVQQHDPRSGARSLARKLALQAIYRLQINEGPWQDVLGEFQSAEEMPRADREYFADEVSIADFAIIGWAWRHERHRVDLARYPHVQRWYATMMARPGTRRGFEVALS